MFDRHLCENLKSKSRKTTDSTCCQLQNLSFEAALTILENLYPYLELDSFPVLKDLTVFKLLTFAFSEIAVDVNTWDALMLYNKMCQHLKDLDNLVKQYIVKSRMGKRSI